MKSRIPLIVALLLGAAPLACTSEDPFLSGVNQAESEIINGTTTSPYFMRSVGAMVARQGMYQAAFCSGTLVAQNLVLTAGHCLEKVTVAQTSFHVGNSANGAVSSTSVAAKQFIFHPKYKKNQTPPSQLTDYYDIALVKLAKGMPYAPAKMVRKQQAPYLLKLGEKVLLMGYGKTNAKTNSGGTRMQGFSTLKMIGTSELWADNSNWAQKCFGDSGGPTLMKTKINGITEWHVVGVASRTGKDCTYGSVETRVDVFLPWIHKYGSIPCGSGLSKNCSGTTTKDSGVIPKKDVGKGKAMGASCSSGAECFTKLCIHSAGKNICSMYCDISKNNCPGIWECRPLAGSTKGACIKPDKVAPPPDMGAPATESGTLPRGVLGDPCEYHSDCLTNLCGSANGKRFCTKMCTPGTKSCGDKMKCVPTGGGTYACVPDPKAPTPDAGPPEEEPEEEDGCEVGGSASASPLALFLLALVFLRRRCL